jgi:hypothetical protein
MVNVGRANLFKRKDGKYLIYIPLDLAEDSMFPFKNYRRTKRGTDSIRLKVSFKPGDEKLIIEKWKEAEPTEE